MARWNALLKPVEMIRVYLCVVWSENVDLQSNQCFRYTISLVLIKSALNVQSKQIHCLQCKCVCAVSVLLFQSVPYLVAVHTGCAGNELRHSNIMTTFHLIPSTPRALEDDGNLDEMFRGLGSSLLARRLSLVHCNIKARLERERMAAY